MLDRVICYGAGSAFHWVEEVLEKRLGVQVVAIIDANYRALQNEFHCPVLDSTNTDTLKKYAIENQEIPVVITLGNPDACSSVAEKLTQLGFREVFTLNEIFESHLGFQLDDTRITDFYDQPIKNRAEIECARQALADIESRQIFDAILNIYQTKKGEWITARSVSELQFPQEFVKKIDYSCVVRCGAALDELQEIIGQNHHTVKKLICFEPDTEQFEQDGQSYLGFLNASLPRSALNTKTEFLYYPHAVFSHNARSNFLSVALQDKRATTHSAARKKPKITAFGSRLSAVGNCQVDTVTLDAALYGHKPTLIIADAEGAELDILQGAKACITQHRPTLVFALYHRFSHLWEIINFLQQNADAYQFFIRNFTGFAYETFLYALPLNDSEV